METASLDIEYLNTMKAKSGLSVQDIADRANVPPSTVSRILSGGTPNPGVCLLADICRVMGASLDTAVSIESAHESESTHEARHENARLVPHIKEAYSDSLQSSRASYNNAYAKMEAAYGEAIKSYKMEVDQKEQRIQIMDAWLKRMFNYSISVTVAAILVMIISIKLL